MKILFMTVLEERHATTKRSRMIMTSLRQIGHSVTYVESNLRVPFKSSISVEQPNTLLGHIFANWKRFVISIRSQYDLLFLQKMIPFHIPCILVARVRNKTVFIDIDDIDTEYQPTRFRRLIYAISDRAILKLVHFITTHNFYLKAELERMGGKNLILLNQCVDLSVFRKSTRDPFLKSKYDLCNKTVFAFLGSFSTGSCSELPAIIGAFSQARKKRSDIVLLLIMSPGPHKGNILERIAKLSLTGAVRILGPVATNEVPLYLSLASCGLVYMEKNRGNTTRFSMKLLDYLAMEIPVIGKLQGASLEYLGKFCRLVDSVEELSDNILHFPEGEMSHPDSKRYLQENHDFPVLERQLRQGYFQKGL